MVTRTKPQTLITFKPLEDQMSAPPRLRARSLRLSRMGAKMRAAQAGTVRTLVLGLGELDPVRFHWQGRPCPGSQNTEAKMITWRL